MDFPQNEFWDWTLPTYGQDGVSPACLRLQDRHGVDVNVVLYAVWVASLGAELTDTDVAAAARRVDDWHVLVVRGLRVIRTELKANPNGAPPELADSFRDGVKKLELDSERMEHIVLGSEVPDDRDRGADIAERRLMAERSVRRYLQLLGDQPDPGDVSAIQTIVAAGVDGRAATT
jgi:uncharacterized protein (TIGR02444 family)